MCHQQKAVCFETTIEEPDDKVIKIYMLHTEMI